MTAIPLGVADGRRVPRGWRSAAHDLRSRIAVVVLLLLAVAALAGPSLYGVDPDVLDFAQSGAAPSARYPLGTDESGRDVLSRLLVGGRVSLAVGLASMILSVTIGTAVGVLAGLGQRWADALLMRLTDATLSIPTIFVVISVLTFLGPSVPTLVLAIGATSWMGLARLVRGELFTLRAQGFVEAARALGARPAAVLFRHLLPHLLPLILVNATIGVASAILTESALSFLGLGVQPPVASWGNMLSGAQTTLFSHPSLAMYPGILIVLTVVATNLLGDSLRDAFAPNA